MVGSAATALPAFSAIRSHILPGFQGDIRRQSLGTPSLRANTEGLAGREGTATKQ